MELSHDHKPNQAREKNRIEAAGGYVARRPATQRPCLDTGEGWRSGVSESFLPKTVFHTRWGAQFLFQTHLDVDTVSLDPV